MPRTGVLFCLASAIGFGAMGIFGKLAYDQGATVGTLLSTRFIVASLILWAFVLFSGRAHELRSIPRRDLAIAFALGAIGYGAQAGAYFAALQRIDLPLLAMLLYTYPVMVAVAAVAIGREKATRRTALALLLASTGLVIMLSGAASGALDVVGTVLALSAAVIYSVYILVSDGVTVRVGSLSLSTLVCTGAAVTLTLASAASGDLDPGALSPTGFAWLVAIALVSTVAAIAFFFAGLQRVGPTAASILSTLEPVTTIVLAFIVFGDSLAPGQIAGALLVLSAVVVVRLPAHSRTMVVPA